MAEPKVTVQDQEEPSDGVPIVLVTGASGFVATHVIKQLLEQGKYRVRGTVRSTKKQEKVSVLLMTCIPLDLIASNLLARISVKCT